MTARQEQLVLVGTPADSAAADHWAAVQSWAEEHGWAISSELPAAGEVWGAVATEEVLDGICSPAEAELIYRVRAAGIPLLGVHQAPAVLASLTSPVPSYAA